MLDEDQRKLLKQGYLVWNQWRKKNPDIKPSFFDENLENCDLSQISFDGLDLRRANLRKARLSVASFKGAMLNGADFYEADLSGVTFSEANLSRANIGSTNLTGANFSDANLTEASLNSAHMYRSTFEGANLSKVDLMGATIIESNFDRATLEECSIYGIAAWEIRNLDKATQKNLIITRNNEPAITVDDLEIAQFIHILLTNQKIRRVIDTITSKVVLILGRFTPERKAVLDALREELRSRNYSPVVFDFDKPSERDLTETVSTLAHLSRFVIADITDAKSIPQELQKIIPSLPSLPIQPIILDSQHEYAMFKDFGAYRSVLPPHRYQCIEQLLVSLDEKVIVPALKRAQEIAEHRRDFEASLK